MPGYARAQSALVVVLLVEARMIVILRVVVVLRVLLDRLLLLLRKVLVNVVLVLLLVGFGAVNLVGGHLRPGAAVVVAEIVWTRLEHVLLPFLLGEGVILIGSHESVGVHLVKNLFVSDLPLEVSLNMGPATRI